MQSGVFIMQTKSRNPALTINFENAILLLGTYSVHTLYI